MITRRRQHRLLHNAVPDSFVTYLNPRFHLAETHWQRREFMRRWWRLYRHDRRWTPPAYRSLAQGLLNPRYEHLARWGPMPFHVDAYRRQNPNRPASL